MAKYRKAKLKEKQAKPVVTEESKVRVAKLRKLSDSIPQPKQMQSCLKKKRFANQAKVDDTISELLQEMSAPTIRQPGIYGQVSSGRKRLVLLDGVPFSVRKALQGKDDMPQHTPAVPSVPVAPPVQTTVRRRISEKKAYTRRRQSDTCTSCREG